MATKYSDIIELSKTRTVYSIREESPADWKTFIANDQFNTVLDTAVKAVLNNDAEKHKSIWIAGTYGTGKSHAAAVIKHLLCDPIDDIKDSRVCDHSAVRNFIYRYFVVFKILLNVHSRILLSSLLYTQKYIYASVYNDICIFQSITQSIKMILWSKAPVIVL